MKKIIFFISFLFCLTSIFAIPTIELSKTSTDFGTTTNGQPISDFFYIKNIGDSDLTVNQLILTEDPFFGESTVFSGESIVIAPSDSSIINIKFDPSIMGTYSNAISIQHNDPSQTDLTYNLYGVSEGDIVNINDEGLRNAITTNLNCTPAEITQMKLESITDLDASNQTPPVISIEQILNLPNLKRLNLTNSLIQSIAILSDLQYLNQLILDNNPEITDFSPLANMSRLTLLSVNNNQNFDWNIFNSTMNIQELYAQNCNLSVPYPEAFVSPLRKLDIANNQLQSLGFITQSTTLQYLDASNNLLKYIEDYSIESSIPDTVNFTNNPLCNTTINSILNSNAVILGTLPTTQIIIINFPVGGEELPHNEDVLVQWTESGGTGFGALTFDIEISYNNGNSWVYVGNFFDKTEIGSYQFNITPSTISKECLIKISDPLDNSVSATTNLFSIWNPDVIYIPDPILRNVICSNLECTPETLYHSIAPNLTSLTFSGGTDYIQDITGLKEFPNLISLNLSYTNLTNINDLNQMTQLDSLILNACNLDSLNFLNNLINLTYAEFKSNKIKSITPLYSVSSSLYCALEGNPLSNYAVLHDKPQLEINGITFDENFPVAKSISIINPENYQTFLPGASINVVWNEGNESGGGAENVAFAFSSDDGKTWENLIPSTINDFEEAVTLPNYNARNCYLKIYDAEIDATPCKDSINLDLFDPATFNADFYADKTVVSISEEFTLNSEVTPFMNYCEWEISKDNFNKHIFEDEHPVVSLPESGTYTVTLTAHFNDTTDTETKTGYITVIDNIDYGLITFNEFDNSTNETSGTGIDYMLDNPEQSAFTQDRFGNDSSALSFNYNNTEFDLNLNSYIETDLFPSVAFGQPVTYSFWIKINPDIEYIPVAGIDDNDWSLTFNVNSQKLIATLHESQYYTYSLGGTALDLNDQWHHIVYMQTGDAINDSLFFFFDGENIERVGLASNFPSKTSTLPLTIGLINSNYQTESISTFSLDEFRIYNRRLSHSEIKQLYDYEKKDNPKAKFSVSDSTIYINETINFYNDSFPQEYITSYLWDFDDGTISTEFAPSHIYETPGDYYVSLKVTTETAEDSIKMSLPINVRNEPGPPTISLPDNFYTNEDDSLVIDFSQYISDPDNTYEELHLTGYQTDQTEIFVEVVVNGMIVKLFPNPDYFGTINLTFEVNDEQIRNNSRTTVTDTVNLVVSPINDAPVINLPEQFTFNEDTIFIEDFFSYISDIDSQNLTLSASQNDSINVEIAGTEVQFSAPTNWNGSEEIIFTVNDNQTRATASDTVLVIVNPVNDAPVVTNEIPDYTLLEDFESFSINLLEHFSDPENDDLTFFITNMNDEVVGVELADSLLHISSYENQSGNTDVYVTANDNHSRLTTSTSFSITINPVNDAPVINLPEQFTFNEDTIFIEDFFSYISDIDSQNLTLSASQNDSINVEIAGTEVQFSAPTNWNGSEEIIFTVNDNQTRATASDTVLVVVNPVNDAPEMVLPDEFTTNEDVSLILDFSQYISDPDNTYDELHLTGHQTEQTEQLVEIVINGMNVTLNPIQDFYGTVNLTFEVNDNFIRNNNNNVIVSDTVDLVVFPVNDAPAINLPEQFTFDEDTIFIEDFISYISDIDSQNLTLTASQNDSINVEIAGTEVQFSAPTNWNGSEEIIFTVNDNQTRATASDTVLVVVNPVNDAPVLTIPESFTILEDESLVLTTADYVSDIDTPVDFLQMVAEETNNEDILIIENNGNTITITPIPNWNGTINITFRATDETTSISGGRATAETTANLIVEPQNDSPHFINTPTNIELNVFETTTIELLPNIEDPDLPNDSYTYEVNGNNHVSIEFVGNSMILTPDQQWIGFEPITIKATDSGGEQTAFNTNLHIYQILGDATNPSPANSSTNNNIYGTFTWENPSYLGEFMTKVYFGISPLTMQVLYDGDAIEEIPIPILAFNTTYYWKVVCYDESNPEQPDGEIWSFSTGTLYPPTEISPAQAETDVSPAMIFSWANNSNGLQAEGYYFSLKNSLGEYLIEDFEITDELSFDSNQLEIPLQFNQTYHWLLTPFIQGVSGLPTTWMSFTTENALAVSGELENTAPPGNIYVPQDSVLTVTDRAIVSMQPGTIIGVYGTLYLNGAQVNSSSRGNWDGIIFFATSEGSTLINSTITGAISGIDIRNTSPTIQNCNLIGTDTRSADETGIKISSGSDAEITDCDIEGYGTGIEILNSTNQSSIPTLTNVRIRNTVNSSRDETNGITINGNVLANIEDLVIEDFATGISYIGENISNTRDIPTITNVRIRNTTNSSRPLNTGLKIQNIPNIIVSNDSINNYSTAIDISSNSILRSTSTPTLTNVRIRNTVNSSRDAEYGIKLTGDVSPQMNDIIIENYDNGVHFVGDNTELRDIPTLTNVRIRNTTNSSRNLGTGIYVENIANIHAINDTIENYATGILIQNTNNLRATSIPTLTNVRIRNTTNSSRLPGYGIRLLGDVSPQLEDIIIEGYNYGIHFVGNNANQRDIPTLTNVRIRNTTNSSRTGDVGLYIENIANIETINDTIDNFETAIHILNTDLQRSTSVPTLTNVRIRNTTNSSRNFGTGIIFEGNISPMADNVDISDCENGIQIFGQNTSLREVPTLTNVRIRNTTNSSRQISNALHVQNISQINIENWDIENAISGIEISNTSNTRETSIPTLTNVRIRNTVNSSREANTAIEITGDVIPQIEDIVIENYAKGITYSANIQQNLRDVPTLTNVRIRNTTNSSRTTGTGMEFINVPQITVLNDTIEYYSEGIKISSDNRATSIPTLTNVRIRNTVNSSRPDNYGIYAEGNVLLNVSDSDIEGYNTGILYQNANLTLRESIPTLTNVRIRNTTNSSRQSGVGIDINNSSQANVENALLENYLIGVRTTNPISGHITNSIFKNCLKGTEFNSNNNLYTVKYNDFYLEEDQSLNGSIALYLNSSDSVYIHNNTIYHYEKAIDGSNSNAITTQNIFWGNTTSTPFGTNETNNFLATYSIIDFENGVYPGEGNLNADPLFTNPEEANFNLTVYSPAINAGDPNFTLDIDNTTADIGAHYFHYILPEFDLPNEITFNEDEYYILNLMDYISNNIADENHFSVNISEGEFISTMLDEMNVLFSAPANWNGFENIIFTLNDNQERGIVSDTLKVVVSPVNDAPVIQITQSLTMNENSTETLDFTPFISDIDNDISELSLISNGSEHIAVTINDFNVEFTPETNWFGTENIEFTVTDGQFRRSISLNPKKQTSKITENTITNRDIDSSDTIEVTVQHVNRIPIIALPDTLYFNEDDEVINFDLSEYISDEDNSNDELTLSVSNNDIIGVEITGLTISLTTEENWFGSDEMTFTVDDGIAETRAVINERKNEITTVKKSNHLITSAVMRQSSSDNVVITFLPVNDAPFVQNEITDFEMDEDTTDNHINLNNVFSDVDDDTLSFSYLPNENINISIVDGIVNITPNEDWFGESELVFIATDPEGLSAEEHVNITVNDVEEELALELPDSFSFNEDSQTTIDFRTYITATGYSNLEIAIANNENIFADINGFMVTLYATENFDGSENVTFIVQNIENNDEVSDDVLIIVNPMYDPPIISFSDTIFIDEDSSISVDFEPYITLHSEDLQASLSIENNNHIEIAVSDYTVSFTPQANWNGSELLTLNVSDNYSRGISSIELPITVNPINDAPFVQSPINEITFDEDTTDSSINLNDVFNDVDLVYGDELTFSVISSEHITGSIEEDILSLTPETNWIGSENITISAIDSYDESVSEEFTVTIQNENDAPSIDLPNQFTFDEDTSLEENFTPYIFDIDGDDLTLTASQNEIISVSIDGTNVIFSAPENWSGTEEIVFTINDNQLRAIDSDSVLVTVNPINDAPFVQSPINEITFDEDTTDSSINLNDVFNDVDLVYGDELTFSVISSEHITGSIEEDILSLTPDTNWIGSENITISAIDSYNESVSEEFTVTIQNVNDAPSIDLPANFTIQEDTPTEWDLTGFINDIDLEDNLILTTSNSEHLEITINGFIVTITPAENWNGTENVNFIINDQNNRDNFIPREIDSDEVAITVTAVNDAPFIQNPVENFQILEDVTNSELLLSNIFSDVDLPYGDELGGIGVSSQHINVNIINDNILLTPTTNWVGSENISIIAFDSANAMTSYQIQIEVINVNDAPTINLPPIFTFNEDESVQLNLAQYVNDIDGDDLLINAENSEHIFIEINGFIATFTSTENWYGNETISITVDDQNATTRSRNRISRNRESVTDQMLIQVNPSNDAPFVSSDFTDISFEEDFGNEIVNLSSHFMDIDGDELTYSVSQNNEITELEVLGDFLSINSIPNLNGETTITVTASDSGSRETVSTNFILTITPVNDAPILDTINPVVMNEDEEYTLSLSANDFDDDALNYNAESNITELSTSISQNNLTIIPVENWNGTGFITVMVSDGEFEAYQTFEVTVSPINDAPVVLVEIQDFEIDEDFTTFELDLSDYIIDPDNDEIIFTISYDENIISINQENEILTISSLENVFGETNVMITADDGIVRNSRLTTATQFNLTINPINDAPIITSFLPNSTAFEVFDSEPITFSVIAEDVESNELSYTWFINEEIMPNEENSTFVYSFISNGNYEIKCEVFDGEDITSQDWNVTVNYVSLDENDAIPTKDILIGNYPNPFNPITKINFGLSKQSRVRISIYNLLGQKINDLVNSEFERGYHVVEWDGKDNNGVDVTSGVYFYQLKTNDMVQMKKMILLK